MASIVAEILTTRGKADVEELNTNITNLSSEISLLKSECKDVLQSKYVEFKSQVDRCKTLTETIESLAWKIDVITDRINSETKADLQNSTGELETLSQSLEKVTLKLEIMKVLVAIDNKMNESKTQLIGNNYYEAATRLSEIRELISSLEGKCEPNILRGLKNEALLREESLLYEGDMIWRNSLVLEVKNKKHIFCISMQDSEKFIDLLRALDHLRDLELKVKFLSDHLLQDIVLVIMQKGCIVSSVASKDKFEVEIVRDVRDSASIVINNLRDLFKFLEMMLTLPTDSSYLISVLGQKMSEQFCDMFIKEVLTHAIPNHNMEMEAYNEVLQSTLNLQMLLFKIGFLENSNQSIMQYASNVDVHFANKLCQQTMNQARIIMKKDLHDVTESEEQDSKVPDICISTLEHGASEQSDSFSSLSLKTFQFPKCSISKSAVELNILIQDILKECSASTDLRAVRLYCTARKIIEMYCAITPVYHKNYLDTVPQQAALFHNNCMYLSHQLLTLGPEFCLLLNTSLPDKSLTFADLVNKLRQTGAQVFLAQMQVQRKQLLEILRDSGLSNLGEGDRLQQNTEKCIRQCLRQLELLQKVWQNCLPSNVYSKAIGTLLNTLVEEIIVRVCTAEDIPAETATDLVTLLNTVVDRAPRVLLEAGEVYQYTKRWRTLEELIQVLGANLQGIDDRWADGKGPLAQEFSSEQVKQLVRALFQNTARRAHVLDKIR